MEFRLATGDDLNGMCLIMDRLEYEKWSRGQLEESLNNPHTRILVCRQSGISGFCIYTITPPEAVLALIAVEDNRRRLGIGTGLFNEMIKLAAKEGTREIFLEVRTGNTGAIEFYENIGCVSVGRRKGFYRNPPDDAFVYRLDIPDA